MSLWVVRTGRQGQFEQAFLDDSAVYCTWDAFYHDLANVETKEDLKDKLRSSFPAFGDGKIANHAGQILKFVKLMSIGDTVVVPSKQASTIHVCEITSEYSYLGSDAPDPYMHRRSVNWMIQDFERELLDSDLLYSINSPSMTIFQPRSPNAENRIRAAIQAGAKNVNTVEGASGGDGDVEIPDLEAVARDEISKAIISQFKGREMEYLIQTIFESQGYTTYRSKKGADGGVDLLVSSGGLGFKTPKICVQVKSGSGKLDMSAYNGLKGAMDSTGADCGLIVSWGGFTPPVLKANQSDFFRVRLWGQSELIDQLLQNYEAISDEIKTLLPLKRIWTVFVPDK